MSRTKEQDTKIAAIIHTAAATAAASAGMSAQIPMADNVVLSGIEIAMVIAIGEVLGQEITRSAAWSLVLSQLATLGGRAASQVLIGWIPIAGNITNAITASTIVEAIGWYIADYLTFNNCSEEN
ncbi:hypothetical protein [Butyrivibrio proteoclasticus]|nr:hypothetical protein [Butyrivibrio proteoclasticus]